MIMPMEMIEGPGAVLRLTIRGVLGKAEYDRTIRLATEVIARQGVIRVLAILDGFEGWKRGDDWEDVSFTMQEGRRIERMAIVGDERWKDEVVTFTARGLRPTAIEFFAVSRMNEARAWLNA
jgi:hypothetical protein